jgi:ornithine carbamoyltransferase
MVLLTKRNLLSMQDLSRDDIHSLISKASIYKKNRFLSERLLKGKTLGLIFQKPSTRTRVSFEIAMMQLGGNTIYLNSNDLQLARGESIEDTAKTLSLYVDILVARVFSHSDVEDLARYSNIPVINGLSDLYHPCQAMADLMTINENKGRLEGLKLAWVGDGNNVFNDLLIACVKAGIFVTAAIPRGYEPPAFVLKIAEAASFHNKPAFKITNEPNEAADDADVIATDTFISIGSEDERDARKKIFLPKFQINSSLMKLAKSDSIFMHCLPAKRGEEVTAQVLDGKSSVVWDEAENRLHIQKAILESLVGGVN